jgi:hypothetical protein
MKKYKSKIGLGLILFILLILGGTLVIMIADQAWLGLIIIIAVAAFTLHLFLNTYYIVDGHHLMIRSGFLYHKIIDIHTIRKIEETNNPISSPAASFDRIFIRYNAYDWVIISPEHKMDFINHLMMLNDRIEVVLKKDKNK